MKAVLQAMAKRMNPVLRQLAADALAEPAVEGGEHRLRVGEGKRQQRQGAARRQLAEGGARDKEFERAAAQISEHLGIGAEAAFGEHLEPERAQGLAADRLGHLGQPLLRRAADRLVEAETIMIARRRIARHGSIIAAGAGGAKPRALTAGADRRILHESGKSRLPRSQKTGSTINQSRTGGSHAGAARSADISYR